MTHVFRVLRVLVVVAVLAVASLIGSSTVALAYGAADHPLAQLEFSGNCNNPSFPLCAPPTANPPGFGLGGIWLWIEIDADNTGDIAGAGCGHVRGVGGGAGSIRGDVTWRYGTVNDAITAHAFVVGVDPNNRYYIVSIPGGEALAFPTTLGHYSMHPAPGVASEAQVAP
jgi:hypothetical protein